MLPEYKYENIPDWDAPDCCETDPPGDQGCEDCCYDTWRGKLKEVIQQYSSEKEIAEQVEKRLAFLTGRRNSYRTWKEELDKAEDYARAICHQLEILSGQTYKIWHNACKAVEAIETIFCMVRHFYTQVDQLKARYDELQVCISSNTNPALIKGQGILACLDVYNGKLEAIIKTRDDIVKVMLEAIKFAQLLRNNIYSRPCDLTADPCKAVIPPCDLAPDANGQYDTGYRTILCELYSSFECGVDCNPAPKDDSYEARQQKSYKPAPVEQHPLPETENPCCYPAVDFQFDPVIELPICNSEYKKEVNTLYESDDKCVAALAIFLKDKNKIKEALLACKTGLDKAIAEADPKLRCK